MADGQAYSELGSVMDELARRRNVRGPYNVGGYVWEKTGRGPKPNKRGQASSAWSQIFYGESHPKTDTVKAFVDAFELTPEERRWLADVYLFRGLIAA